MITPLPIPSPWAVSEGTIFSRSSYTHYYIETSVTKIVWCLNLPMTKLPI
jgi:hypothetical protein